MSEAYIVDAIRAPVGRKKGSLAHLHPADLAAHPIRELMARTGIDPQAVEAARANAERNGVNARFADSTVPVAGEYDLVVANILSNPLRVLAPAICAHVRAGGRLALSGILREQADEIIAIYAQWLPLKVADVREDWVCLAGTRP